MIAILLPLFAAAALQADDPLVDTMADGSRLCLSLAKQEAFDDSGFSAAGWSRDLAPRWYKANATEQVYGFSGSDTALSVHGPNLFPMLRLCSVEAVLPKGVEVGDVAASVAERLGVAPLDMSGMPIKAAKDEYFYRGADGPIVTIALGRSGGKKTVRALFTMN